MKVVQLKNEHIDDLVYLTHAQVQETISHMPYEESVVRSYAQCFSEEKDNERTRVYLAYNSNDEAVGYLVVNVENYLFCQACLVAQEVVYVLPNYRGTSAAIDLLIKLEEVAEREGALEVYAGVANKFYPEKSRKLLEKYGFENVGNYFRKIL